jgi:hypothetical protein
MLPSEMPASTGEVQRHLEMAHAQLVQYARDLKRLLEREREKTRELTAERTLQGSVKVLTNVLALLSPIAFGRASRLKRYVRHMAQSLGVSEVWQFELAAMLSQVGCITLPTETFEKMYAGQPLSPEEQQMVATLRSLDIDDVEMVAQMLTLHGLCPGMVLAEDIRTKTGLLWIDKGHEVTWVLMERLHCFAQKVGIVEPFLVLVPRQQPWGQSSWYIAVLSLSSRILSSSGRA